MKQSKSNRNLLRFGALLVLVAMWVITPFAIGDRTASAEEMMFSDDIRIGASLTGASIGGVTPSGFAEFRADDQGRRRLDVNGQSINLAAGTVLTISVNNGVVGQASLSTCQTLSFRIESNVPLITAGSTIQVLNGGSVILSGTFGSASPSPSGSPSGSPSPSPSASPCASPSASPSGSPTGSPNPSPSASPTGSPNPSPSASPTGSPNPSPSGSPTGTPNPSPSVSPSPQETPNGPTPTPTIPGSPSPSPSGSPNPSPSPNSGDLFAALTGPTINGILPNGFAQFEIHSSRLELEVRVQQVNLPAGTQLAVIVDGVNVGSMFLSGGEGRLRNRTDNGQPVPQVVVGSTIIIRNGANNIMTGTFRGFTGPSPSPSPTASPSPGGTPGPSPSPSPTFGRSFESELAPAVPSSANAEFRVVLNATETQATIFGTFQNLGSSQTGARIQATVGDGATIHEFGAIGGTSGNFNTVTINVTPVQVAQLRAGLWSAVITTANNPAGEVNGTFRFRSNLADFDGDGSNDLAVYRPSTGIWYTQNNSGFTASQFGSANDKVVSADYDGDGRTDTAVFTPSGELGIWNIKRSSDSGITSEQFGLASDIPARGDYDGDGINDLAVYRPSTGVWYIKKSNGTGFTITRFGLAEDKPLPADMDGDGRDDITVFRPSDGNWYWLRSSDGQFVAVHFGLSGDIPVRADFDGDGKADLTVYRPSNGVWYTTASSNGAFQAIRFGLDGDVPVAGNYDGDNKSDIAVFRPSDGNWYILRSSDGGFQSIHFGLNGDVPAIAR